MLRKHCIATQDKFNLFCFVCISWHPHITWWKLPFLLPVKKEDCDPFYAPRSTHAHFVFLKISGSKTEGGTETWKQSLKAKPLPTAAVRFSVAWSPQNISHSLDTLTELFRTRERNFGEARCACGWVWMWAMRVIWTNNNQSKRDVRERWERKNEQADRQTDRHSIHLYFYCALYVKAV